MIGTIIKIHQLKYSRNGNAVRRIEFKMEDKHWAKTDLCPDFRNYARWEGLLKVGTVLDKLVLRQSGEVDADSYPGIVSEKPVIGKKLKSELPCKGSVQQKLFKGRMRYFN